jgi:hypothetical protein
MFEGLEPEFPTIESESDESRMAYFGRATGLAAVLTSIKDKPLYLSFKTMSRIFSWCISSLRSTLGGSSSSAPKDEKSLVHQCLQQRLAWLIITPLMSVHPNFIKVNVTQLFLLWNSVFNRVSIEDPIISMLTSQNLWKVFLDSRLEALTALYAYLYHQSHLSSASSATSITTETSKKTVKMLENAIALMRNTFPPNVEFDRSAIFSKRIFQIFMTLPSIGHFEGLHEIILNVTKDVFLQGGVGSSLVYGIVNADDISIAGLPVESTFKQFEFMVGWGGLM